jgi:hypothetical protein
MATKIKKAAKKKTPVTKVVKVAPKEIPTSSNSQYTIKNFGTLGREIKISPKSNVTVNEPGSTTEFFVESVSVLIGIGNYHSAKLIMSVGSWEALKKGAEIKITTTKAFKEKFL